MAEPIRIVLGGVNCYLVAADRGFILVDTGTPRKRAHLERELENAGCGPRDLRLIVLTHGDYDHAGNAAYLRAKYGAKVAMHREDLGRVRQGNWSWGLKRKPDRVALRFRVLSLLIKSRAFDKFEPDLCLEDGQSLLRYGYGGTVLHLPGHTKGSIGVLTPEDGLICGDLMDGMIKPSLEFFINDMEAARASLGRLRRIRVGAVYPGHGKPFDLEQVKES
jgi:hydroxyacylglutathione hydrolase